jgi:hypothetical protein
VTGADSLYASACSQFYSPLGCWVGFILRTAVTPDRSAGRPPHVTGASVTAHYAPLLAPHRACLDPPLSGGVLAVLKVIRPGRPAARRAVRRLRGLPRSPWPEMNVRDQPLFFWGGHLPVTCAVHASENRSSRERETFESDAPSATVPWLMLRPVAQMCGLGLLDGACNHPLPIPCREGVHGVGGRTLHHSLYCTLGQRPNQGCHDLVANVTQRRRAMMLQY